MKLLLTAACGAVSSIKKSLDENPYLRIYAKVNLVLFIPIIILLYIIGIKTWPLVVFSLLLDPFVSVLVLFFIPLFHAYDAKVYMEENNVDIVTAWEETRPSDDFE